MLCSSAHTCASRPASAVLIRTRWTRGRTLSTPLAAITVSNSTALLLTGTITAGADPARAAAPVTVLRTGSVALTQEPKRSRLGQRRARGHHIHLAVRELEHDPARAPPRMGPT
jgi:hypothetical protein